MQKFIDSMIWLSVVQRFTTSVCIFFRVFHDVFTTSDFMFCKTFHDIFTASVIAFCHTFHNIFTTSIFFTFCNTFYDFFKTTDRFMFCRTLHKFLRHPFLYSVTHSTIFLLLFLLRLHNHKKKILPHSKRLYWLQRCVILGHKTITQTFQIFTTLRHTCVLYVLAPFISPAEKPPCLWSR